MNSHEILDDNLETARGLIIEAAARGADVIGLPENFSLMAETNEQRQDAARRVAEVEAFLSEMAKAQGVVIIGGSTPFPATDGLVTNSCLMFDRAGRRLCRYDKIHLFDVEVDGKKYHESQAYSPGKNPKMVPTPWFRIGLSICYDLRFPELYRSSELKDVELISVPSAFTKETGEAHWLTLLRSRAIENLAFIVAANQWGKHYGARETFGNSVIIDPWGRIMDIKEEGEGLVTADIDIQELKSIRRKFPALNHREIYT